MQGVILCTCSEILFSFHDSSSSMHEKKKLTYQIVFYHDSSSKFHYCFSCDTFIIMTQAYELLSIRKDGTVKCLVWLKMYTMSHRTLFYYRQIILERILKSGTFSM